MEERERGTIAICFVREALVEVRRRGLGADAMLRAADITPTPLAAPQARVSPDRYGALWHAIAEALDDELFGMAITYLGRAGLTVGEVAARLGFAEPSAFHRASKKWTGAARGYYRRAREREVPAG